MRSKEALAQAAGISVRSVSKLEQPVGQLPVGSTVLEAVGRALPNWTEDTPRLILEGEPAPPTTPIEQPSPVEDSADQFSSHTELSEEDKARLDVLKKMIGIEALRDEIRYQLLAYLLEGEGIPVTPESVITFIDELKRGKAELRARAPKANGAANGR